MNDLESRKRLLIAESELNRAQLADEIAALKSGAWALTYRAVAALNPIAASAAALALGLAACRRPPPAADASSSRMQTLSDGATLLAALWLAFQTPARRPDSL
jgi:hypothetical protein